jgi:uncharacterized glyoxalase superfamily protein PhnB
MNQQGAPHINFQGPARKAMFYHAAFGGKLDLYSADEQGRPRKAEPGDRIMHARLSLTDQPWGGAAGWLMDRFGINWNVDVEKP